MTDLLAPLAHGLPHVEGTSLRLRALVAADADAVFELYRDREANRFGYSPEMSTPADAARLIDEISALAERRTLFHWGVARRSDDRVIGHATVFNVHVASRRAEIGYSIRRADWGRGLGTEAVATLLRFAFEQSGFRRIEADVDPRNVGSLRVLEKLGFVREGHMRERWELGGEIQDAIVFGLLRREFTGRPAPLRPA